MAYNRNLESNAADKRAHDALQKKLATDRLVKNKAWNAAHKRAN